MERLTRCAWALTPVSVTYHDREWGVPVYDDQLLFEFLLLEGAQAGLSWETILGKREAYRNAFVGFDPRKVARFTPARLERLLRRRCGDEGFPFHRDLASSLDNGAIRSPAPSAEHQAEIAALLTPKGLSDTIRNVHGEVS